MIDAKDAQGFVEAFLPTPKYKHEELEAKAVEGAAPSKPTFMPSKVTREGLGLPEAAPLKEGIKKSVKSEEDIEVEDALSLLGNISLSDMRMNQASQFNPSNSSTVDVGERVAVSPVGSEEVTQEETTQPRSMPSNEPVQRLRSNASSQKLQGINSTNTPESELTVKDLGKIAPIKPPVTGERPAAKSQPSPSFMESEPPIKAVPQTYYDKFKDLNMSTPENRANSLAKIASAFGIPEKAFVGIAAIESSMGVHTRPHKRADGRYASTAKGMYQILNRTWDDILNKSGGNLGIAGKSRDDHVASALAAAQLLKNNKEQLGRYYEEPVDLYLAHFLGATGARKFKQELWMQKKSGVVKPASSVFAEAAESNPNIFYKNPHTKQDPRTLGEIRALFNSKLLRGAATYGYT